MENIFTKTHKHFNNVRYDDSFKELELQKIKQINSMTETLEVVGKVDIDVTNSRHALFLNLADIHYGGQGFNRDKFIKVLKWGKMLGCYATILGDSLDLSTSNSATNVQTYQTNNEKSVRGLTADLQLISNNIIAMLPGNHTAKQGNRIKDLGICQERPIAEKLGVPYYPYHAVLDLKTKNGHYYIGLTHGDLGNDFQTSADKLIETIKAEKGIVVDAVMLGHYHNYCSYDKVYEYTEYDELLKSYVKKYKTITVEEMPAFQEQTEYSVTQGFMGSGKANARAFDLVLDENGNVTNVISFNILDNSGNLTQTAQSYLHKLALVEKEQLKEVYRQKYAKALQNAKTATRIEKITEQMDKEM